MNLDSAERHAEIVQASGKDELVVNSTQTGLIGVKETQFKVPKTFD
jgi:hypothetical protein